MTLHRYLALAALLASGMAAPALAAESLAEQIDRLAEQIEPKVIKHRRHIHQNPELSNREFETAKYVAKHLRNVGIEVQTGVAKTGVVGILRGGRPGPVVALRADMDALPVTEETTLPFRSKARATFDGKEVGVMHACGHDGHTGMLLGVAEVIARLKDQWPGTVKFIFQPAEESPPLGEEGGAQLMLKEGVLKNDPRPEVIFGQHILTAVGSAGEVGYRAGAMLASSDTIEIVVEGKGGHGAAPWKGVDPIVVASQIVLALQTIASRQMDVTQAPVIVTIGKIEGGTRANVIPDTVTMKGTLRSLDADMRQQLKDRVRRTAEGIAHSAGATVKVSFGQNPYPVTVNDAKLTARMLPTLQRVAGDRLVEVPPILGGEDFSFFAQEIPGLYLFLGGRPANAPAEGYPSNHSPRFDYDESVLKLGVRAMAHLAADYAQQGAAR
ncbi:MAG: amidohydrolase [Gammaproteobacteria bacterium]